MTYGTPERWRLIVRKFPERTEVREMEMSGSRGAAQQYAVDAAKEFDPTHELGMWGTVRHGDLVVILRGTAPMKAENMTRDQKKLVYVVEQDAIGADLRDVLIAQDAPAKDKAVVADFFGGVGAGDEFRSEHISKRGRCRHCTRDGFYYDGIRDPYWKHETFGSSPHAFQPNDAHTRLVFEKTGSRYRR